MGNGSQKYLFNVPSWLWLIPLLLLVFWLGARELNEAPFWGDERRTIRDAFGQMYVEPLPTPMQIWTEVAQRNPWHAPGYFILLNRWGALVGWSEVGLRAPSLFFGVLAVAWVYRLGGDWVSARVGLYGALVMGTSALFIHYLYYLRVYTLFALLTASMLWLYGRIVFVPERARNKPVSIWLWVTFLLGAVAMLYVHYFAALPLATIGLYHLLFARKNRRWWLVVGVLLMTGVLFLPWLNTLLVGLADAVQDEDRQAIAIGAPEVLNQLVYVFSNGLPLFLMAALVLAISSDWRKTWRIWFFALVILASMLVVNAIVPVITLTRMRYLLVLWPLLAMLIGMGITQLEQWRFLPLLALAAWAGIGLWNNFNPSFEVHLNSSANEYKFPWPMTVQAFRAASQPDDMLIVQMPDGYGSVAPANEMTTSLYLTGTFVRSTVIESLNSSQRQPELYIAAEQMISENDPLRVWLGYETNREIEQLANLQTTLEARYDVCPVGLAQSTARFDLFTRAEVCCLPREEIQPLAQFGEGIRLVAMEHLPDMIEETLPVILSWSVDGTVPSNIYSVALHVTDREDALVAQADYPLPNQVFRCVETPISLVDLPTGEYNLYAVVYAWESRLRLMGQRFQTGEQGERLLLGRFKIAR